MRGITCRCSTRPPGRCSRATPWACASREAVSTRRCRPRTLTWTPATGAWRCLAALAPARLCLAHFGPVPDPQETLARAREQLARAGEATRAAVAGGGGTARIAAELDRLLPLEPAVRDPVVVARWRRLGWAEANVDGLAGWAESLPSAEAR